MTDKQKAAFLKREKWRYERSIFPDIGGLYWKDRAKLKIERKRLKGVTRG